MTWDYRSAEEFVRIEIVKGDEVVGLIAEIPLTGLSDYRIVQVECAAEAICNAHNQEH